MTADEKDKELQQQVIRGFLDDYYQKRRKIYAMNFWRGLFFGLGAFVGGTIVVAIIIWLLSRFADVPGWVGDFINSVVKIIDKK